MRGRPTLRRYILDVIAASKATGDATWMFADSRSSNVIDSAAAQDYEEAARKRGVPFISVILGYDLEEDRR
ncbi:hypothetical protein QQZ08_003113 [Neonectria magnoliae]|uniref:Uncharacterized protein n=1 Tax=Neonectria magnoliae TaxID=2732573 RepID=A0ABR1I9X6_9HYPO